MVLVVQISDVLIIQDCHHCNMGRRVDSAVTAAATAFQRLNAQCSNLYTVFDLISGLFAYVNLGQKKSP